MFTIRNAHIKDIPLIRELVYKVWPQTYKGIITDDQIEYMLELMYSESSLERQMKEGAQFIIIAVDNKDQGYASFQDMGGGIFKLHKLYVLPGQQGKGTGRYMIEHVMNEVKKANGNKLQLQVNKGNKARSFYEKLGFVISREFILDIGSGYVMDDYLMEKEL